ncbi:unnamed protein product [Staurois parvus]|uniref:Uncharacterized protein n=1 Tax=Staurois parvus TaxID=386267 RepID=A0ABN9B7Y2_9NEOB|nr:unnamed protein product [Staurois parvus]
MLLPGPECVMGPRTDSSCCLQARNLSWAPVPPPHAAARSRVCHGSLYGPPIAAARPVICHGPPCTDSSCCCQARNLSWAPVPPPHAAARSRVCHGSLYGLPLLLSLSPHSAMCHFQVSSHCWWFPFLS